MNCVLHVETGPAAGYAAAWSAEVCRVGSDPSMTMVIGDLPPHAITIIHRDGQLQVINRGCQDLRWRSKRVPIGKSIVWRRNEPLTIDGRARMRWQEPQEAATIPPTSTDHAAGSRLEAPCGSRQPASSSSRPTTMWTALVLLVLVSTYGLAFGFGEPQSNPRSESYLRQLFTELQQVPLHDLRMQRAERLLRRASILELRQEGRPEALATYQKLRELLGRQAVDRPKGIEKQLLSYVEHRMKQLH